MEMFVLFERKLFDLVFRTHTKIGRSARVGADWVWDPPMAKDPQGQG